VLRKDCLVAPGEGESRAPGATTNLGNPAAQDLEEKLV